MGTVGGERFVFVVKSGRDKCDGGSRLEMSRAIERRDGRGVGVDWTSREEVDTALSVVSGTAHGDQIGLTGAWQCGQWLLE